MGSFIESSVFEVGTPLHSVEVVACEVGGLEGVGCDRFETLEPYRVSRSFLNPSLCSVLFLGREETV